jgi:hypothetical protein
MERLFYTEEEEDAQWAFDQAFISKAELEDVLAELEFDNTEISIEH